MLPTKFQINDIPLTVERAAKLKTVAEVAADILGPDFMRQWREQRAFEWIEHDKHITEADCRKQKRLGTGIMSAAYHNGDGVWIVYDYASAMFWG